MNSEEAGAEAWALFDRDTQTRLAAGTQTKVQLNFGEVRSVQALKVFGTAPYALRLLDGEGHGIGAEIDLREGGDGAWNVHLLPEAVSLAAVTLDLRAFDGGGEVGDIELWAAGPGRSLVYAPEPGPEADSEPPAHVDTVAGTPESLTLGPEGERELCGAFRFELPRHPGAYRRMWLRASIAGAYRPFALTRAINAHSMIRAHWVPGETSRSYVQPIDPELLFLGSNEVHYCVPAEAGAEVTIDGVEILGELDHGSNFIESATVAPYDAAPTRSALELLADAPVAVTLGASEELVLAFDRLVSIDAILLDAPGSAEWTARCVDESAEAHPLALAETAEDSGDAALGTLRVTSGGERCAGLRLSRQGGGVIDGVRVFGSGAARRVDFPQIVLASAREHFGYEAWVEGWARAPSSIGGGALLTVEGTNIGGTPSGIYGRMLTRSTGPAEPWVVNVTARFADGSETTREFVLDGASGELPGSDGLDDVYDDGLTELERESRYGREGQTASRRFGSGEAGRVALGTHAAIEIPEGAVQGQADIGMTQLSRGDLPALDPGMINVTAPFARGYEFSPHGQRFSKTVTITLPYQENLLPAGYTGHDVETFFFDEELGRWERLARAEVDARSGAVQSLSDHFTTMINAVVVTPEHPQIASFDGNRIQGLEAASPAAGITTIAPPEVNNRGDAVLSYPLTVPPGRMGLQPELAITYNSSAGNGWLGVGWDLGVSTISVDTRRGVPRYEATKESETYLLDGQQLSPDANSHDGFDERDLSAETKEFRPRVEGAFQRIVRHGRHPSRFRWEVTSRTGVTFYYGAGTGERIRAANATLSDDDGNIFRWALREIRDAHGNRVRFDYDLVRVPGADLEGRELYLRSIHYTLTDNQPSGVYQVHFCSASGRPDPIISARGGFKEVLDRLLGRIEVHYAPGGTARACTESGRDTQVRAWRLQYGQDPFGKSQLRTIAREGARRADAPWDAHHFEYFDEVTGTDNPAGEYDGFGASSPVSVGGPSPDPGFALARVLAGAFTGAGMAPDVSMLGGNVARSVGAHFYVGFNGGQPRKRWSFGGKIGSSFTQSEGMASLIDIDGDSLPDRVYCERRRCFYNRNLTALNGNLSFSDTPIAIGTLDGMFRERSFDFNFGPEAHLIEGSVYVNHSFSFTRGVRYLSDVNADGLVDVVDGSSVLFNRLNGDVPEFLGTSAGTPVPIGATTARIEADLDELMAEYAEVAGPVDTLRIWQAPRPGRVRVRGSVTRDPAAPAGDGFDAAVERVWSASNGYASSRLWEHGFDSGAEASEHDVEVDVHAGDYVIFRLHARGDGTGDRVQWDPTIAYTTDTGLLDENRLAFDRFRASRDFVLAGREAAIEVPHEGVIRVTGTLRKLGVTSDRVRLEVLRNDEVASSIEIAAGAPGVATLDEAIDVEAEDKLRVRVATDTPIDLRRLTFEAVPRATYVEARDAAGTPLEVVDWQGNPLISERLPFDMSTFSPGLRVGRGAHVPEASSELVIDGRLLARPFSGPYVVAAKSGSRLLAKAVVDPRESFVLQVPVVAGEEVFFTVNGTRPGDVPLDMTLSVVSGGPRGMTLPWRDYFVPRQNHLPRPYRGWMAAAYKPDAAGFDAPIDGNVLFGEGNFDEDDRADEENEGEDSDAGTDVDGGVEERGAPEYEGSREERRPSMRAIAEPEPCTETDPNQDPDGAAFEQANPLDCERPAEPHWVGPEDAVFVTADGMGTSRLGPDASAVFAGNDGASGNGRGTIRISRGQNHAIGGGIFGVGVGRATSDGYGVQDFLDMNGDGFPDIVTRDGVAYSMPHGGLGETESFGAGEVRSSEGTMMTIGAGASTPRSKQNGSGTQGVATTRTAEGSQSTRNDPTFGVSINGAGGSSETAEELFDVNGDGLPDRVTVEGEGDSRRIEVRLNLGYRFAPRPIEWVGAAGGIHVSSTWEVSGGVSVGDLFTHSWGNRDLSFGGGATATGTRSAVRPPVDTDADLVFENGSTLLDVNGDGLPDAVRPADGALEVRFNRGGSFGPSVLFGGLSGDQRVEASETFASSAGGSITISIGPLCVAACYLILNPGLNGSNSVSRPTLAVRDVDGDGFADVVSSSTPNAMSYARNNTARTGLLKRVIRPLGAELALDYERAGNTRDMPHSRWTLSRVKVYDGVDDAIEAASRSDYQLMRVAYGGGRYDRVEREFLGFETVTVEEIDTTGWDGAEATLGSTPAVYRRTTQRYLNRALHERGLLAEATLESGSGERFRTTLSTYRFFDAASGRMLEDDPDTDANEIARAPSVFPALFRSEERQHEGDVAAFVSRVTEQEYDSFGNVETFRDFGGPGAEDDIEATIAYSGAQGACRTAHVVSVPTRITVEDARHRTLRQRTATVACPTPLVTAVSVTTASGAESETTLDYDALGRLESVTYPPNARGQRYSLTYAYDDVIGAHVKSITDAYGYVSTTEHDLRYGAPERETDINGQVVSTAYDAHGRPTSVTGPYEQGSGIATITYAYRPGASTPWARTSHHDVGRGDRIETYSLIDGLGRALQTKKDGTVYVGDETRGGDDVMIVSGRTQYDPWGRVVATWHPTTEALGRGGSFNSTADTSAPPTRLAYDVLDRVVRTTIPESDRTEPLRTAAVTTQSFSLVPATGGFGLWSETKVTDATGQVRQARRDARARIRQVIEHGHSNGAAGTTSATTRYEYDPLDQLVSVIDARENVTRVVYDLAGRRTSIESPDAGETELVYDAAGNVVERITAALRARGESIAYAYDFTHLVHVDHPGTEPDIEYTWGANDAPAGQRGRLTRVLDAAGTIDRTYGPLGEVVRETRRLYRRNEGADGAPDGDALTTEFVYDTWGRIRQMTYPDGEVLTYAYDSGGLVRSATGVKLGVEYPYVERLEYDRFGQRAFEEKGNGIRTHYAYDAATRRLGSLEAGEFQRLEYTYDLVGNVVGLTNDIARGAIAPRGYGGRVEQRFRYDGLHRLVHAEGTWDEPGPSESSYTLDLAYDAIHNLTHKTQTHVVTTPGGAEVTQRETTYDWAYEYAAGGGQPHAPSRVGDRHFGYDASGRQVTSRLDGRGPTRTMLWDSEDRIRAIQDGGETVRDERGNVVAGRGRTTEFVYDATGQRVFKRGAQGETAYVNQFYTLRNGTVATKHVFVGASRVTSKLVPGRAHHELPTETDELSRFLGRWWEHRSESGWEHARNVEMNPHYRVPTDIPSPMGLPESNFIYFYHPDHLGSTSFVTDGGGEVYEHVQYFPHGEVWADERSNTERIPYLFTGKELDQETGLYDFGARMYDPRVGLWASPDPALPMLLDGRGAGGAGVFEPMGLSLNAYALHNPQRFIDPDGRDPIDHLLGSLQQAWSDFQQVQNRAGDMIHGVAHGLVPPLYSRTAPRGNEAHHNMGQVIGATIGLLVDAASTQGDMSSMVGSRAAAAVVAGESPGVVALAAAGMREHAAALADALNGVQVNQSSGSGASRGPRVVNSNMPHAAERATERAGFETTAEARDALQELGRRIEQSGMPEEAIRDPAHADRIIVPGFGRGGAVVYQVGRNGVLKLKTVLEWRAPR